MTYKEDRIENEKSEPSEASSLKFIYVPIVLISLLVGFGVSYLAMKTPNTDMSPGDSRTAQNSAQNAQATVATNSLNNLEVLMEKGKQVYTTTCQACHQANGAGIPGAFPPLAGSEWVSKSGKLVAGIVLHGLQGEITVAGQKFQGVMPPFKDQLKSEDIAAVVTYVRNSFGNKADLVTIEDADAVREKTKARTSSWTEAELKAESWDK